MIVIVIVIVAVAGEGKEKETNQPIIRNLGNVTCESLGLALGSERMYVPSVNTSTAIHSTHDVCVCGECARALILDLDGRRQEGLILGDWRDDWCMPE